MLSSRLYLSHGPCFIPKSVFYTQSVVRSPQAVFFTDRVNLHKRCLFRRYARRAFISKTVTIILFTNTTMNCLGFWGTDIFLFETMKRGTCCQVYRGNPVGFELFSMLALSLGLCDIICAQKFRPAKCNYTFPPLIYSAESSVAFWSN